MSESPEGLGWVGSPSFQGFCPLFQGFREIFRCFGKLAGLDSSTEPRGFTASLVTDGGRSATVIRGLGTFGLL